MVSGLQVTLTDSGTSALSIALDQGGRRSERPVALPAFGCFDLATALDASGSPFVLYDVDPSTLGPDSESLHRALTIGADRVVVAHLYGVPVDVPAVRSLAKPFGIRIIDDAAQGSGASISGRALGTLGDFGVLSFGRGKGVTGGGGGAVLRGATAPPTRMMQLAANPASSHLWLRQLVATLAQYALARPSLYGLPSRLPFLGLGETRYQAPHPVSGISAFALGMLSTTLQLAHAEAGERRRRASRFASVLGARLVDIPLVPQAATPGYLRFPVLAQSEAAATRLRSPRLGILRSYPLSLADLPGFGHRRQNQAEPLSGARILARRLLTLPTHSGVSEPDMDDIEEWCARAT